MRRPLYRSPAHVARVELIAERTAAFAFCASYLWLLYFSFWTGATVAQAVLS